jgi:hypothetical protein
LSSNSKNLSSNSEKLSSNSKNLKPNFRKYIFNNTIQIIKISTSWQ